MLAREGYSTIAVVLTFAAFVSYGVSYIDHWLIYAVYAAMTLLSVLIIFFFRDPERNVPGDDSLIIAPADGSVVEVNKVEEPNYIRGPATQISIFLSPLDVHINRIPATGKIEYVEYHPGVYLMAWDHRASSLNERADFGLRHPSGTPVFFRQITGFLARRIIYHLDTGDDVQAGQRFGLMKFGSRMDILLPSDIPVEVAEGDRTKGGETVLARILS